MNAPETPRADLRKLDDLRLDSSFAALPPQFYTRLQPTPLPTPYLVCASESAAELIGLDPAEMRTERFVEVFTGNSILESSTPLAAVYSGHQFGVWAGQLGDGRAILLGEARTAAAGYPATLELQLKGSGLTPYSRMGDGRAVLRSSIREFLCSEAMAALGIPTSRALCVTGSDQRVMRETVETAAVTTRMAPTFVRFGSFEHWYYNDKHEELKILADYVVDRFYPELRDAPNPYQALLTEVTRRTAELMAQWQAVGFMHGVMNTDNMSILGLTLDYGPFGFLDDYEPGFICNHSDHHGRYAFDRQPEVALWNLSCLGQALLPLFDDHAEAAADMARAQFDVYQETFHRHYLAGLRAKLGLRTAQEGDSGLAQRLLERMASERRDYTNTWRLLSEFASTPAADNRRLRDHFIDREAFDAWAADYGARLRSENSDDALRRLAMNRVNPKYVLRNYLAQMAIERARDHRDYSMIDRLLRVLADPYAEHPQETGFAEPPPEWGRKLAVSCSS